MKLVSYSIILLFLSTNIFAQKSLDKHIHGSIKLDITTNKKQILIILKNPANNFLGFEYKAKSKEEKKKLKNIKNLLTKKVTTLFNKEIESYKTKSPKFKQTFQGKDHSEIHLETYIKYSENIKSKTIEVQLISKFPKIKTIHIQLLRKNRSIVSKKYKNSKFELKL